MQTIFAKIKSEKKERQKRKKERLNEHVAREEDLTGANRKIIPPHPSGYRWKTQIHRRISNREKRVEK
jgi:hypothetical protein